MQNFNLFSGIDNPNMERRYSIVNDSRRYGRRDSIKTHVMKHLCCFCIDLRIGCIIIGSLNVLGGLSTLIILFYRSISWNISLAAASTTASGVLLMWGAITNNKIATIVSLVSSTISFFSYFYTSIVILVKTQDLANSKASTGYEDEANHIRVTGDLIGITFLIATLVQLYYWICVFRYLKQLRNNVYTPRVIID